MRVPGTKLFVLSVFKKNLTGINFANKTSLRLEIFLNRSSHDLRKVIEA